MDYLEHLIAEHSKKKKKKKIPKKINPHSKSIPSLVTNFSISPIMPNSHYVKLNEFVNGRFTHSTVHLQVKFHLGQGI